MGNKESTTSLKPNSVPTNLESSPKILIEYLKKDISNLKQILKKSENKLNQQLDIIANNMASGGKINATALSTYSKLNVEFETTKALVTAEILEKEKQIADLERNVSTTVTRRSLLSIQGGKRRTSKTPVKKNKNLRRKTRK
jgi:primosomal protein N''